MALAAICVDRSSGVAKRLDKVDVLVGVPLERVEVVVYEDGVWPSLVCQFKGLDNPVVASLACASQCFDEVGRACLMSADGFVNNIDELKVGIPFLYGIHPLNYLLVSLGGSLAFNPLWILGTPHKSVKLEREFVVLRIVVCIVGATPIKIVVGSFY